MDLFSPLRVKREYVLLAYQSRIGSAFVEVLPRAKRLPEPAGSPRANTDLQNSPSPPEEVNDVMEAITGDFSARSYLLASILSRELREFDKIGKEWDWTTYRVLDKNPIINPPVGGVLPYQSVSKASAWKWEMQKPEDWRPQVTMRSNEVVVTFYAYTRLGKEVICRYTDTYKRGSYVFETELQAVAIGGDGFYF